MCVHVQEIYCGLLYTYLLHVVPIQVLFWNHCVSKQNEVDYEIMNYPHFFEGCVPAFFELDAVKGS